jgi:hypothetical protein
MEITKKPHLMGTLVGALLASLVIGLLGAYLIYTGKVLIPQKDKWAKGMVQAEYASLSVYGDDKIRASIGFSVENLTGSDYSLPSDTSSMYVIESSIAALVQVADVVWPSGKYLPPNKKVIIEIIYPINYQDGFDRDSFKDLEKVKTHVKKGLKNLSGFVILDKEKRLEIKLFLPPEIIK